MDLDSLKKKLRGFKDKNIIITNHAELQAFVRDIDINEVKKNIRNPEKLVYAKEQDSIKEDEEKYDCYFAYPKHLYHRYVLIIDGKIIIVTIIKINRDWQKAIG